MAPRRSVEEDIIEQARMLGFDDVGITSAELPARFGERLDDYIARDRHGEMSWMADRRVQRASPNALWPEAKSVIALGMNYGPDTDPLPALKQKDRAVISVYAQNKDYHDIIKKREKRLARWIVETHGGDVKVFVDTAPVMEKPLAARAGVGWQGKHTNLVSRNKGSWLFLGAIFSTLTLKPTTPETNHCGSCQNCLDICPTNAFPSPYQLDARRCISYLTIEHKGPIPVEFRKPMGNRIYGCDDCLAICPWNKFAEQAREVAFIARNELREPTLREFLQFDDAGFRAFFSGSPIKRIGRDRFTRNVLIAAGNSDDVTLLEVVTPLLDDASSLVRGAAVWALSQLSDADKFTVLKQRRAAMETDPDVLDEWANAHANG